MTDNNTASKIVKGDIFIVPNPSMGYKDCQTDSTRIMFKNICAEFGIELTMTTKFIDVWCTSEESENWGSHGFPGSEYGKVTRKGANMYNWYHLLPAEILPKKEGETIRLTDRSGTVIELTARQSKYRYSQYGNWESVLAHV